VSFCGPVEPSSLAGGEPWYWQLFQEERSFYRSQRLPLQGPAPPPAPLLRPQVPLRLFYLPAPLLLREQLPWPLRAGQAPGGAALLQAPGLLLWPFRRYRALVA